MAELTDNAKEFFGTKKKTTILEKIKKHIKPIIIIGLIVLVTAGGITYKIIKNKSNNAISYQTAEVSKGTLTVTVEGTGNVIVEKQSAVNPGITGKVYDLAVKAGDKVEEGQFLFHIENNQLDTNVDDAYTSYLQAKQNYESAVSQLLQAQKNQTDVNNKSGATDEEKNIANQQVNAAQIAVDAADNKIDSAWNNYELQKETAAKRTVTAPINGTIISLNVTNGDQLGSTSSGSSGGSNSSSSGSSSSSSSNSSSSNSSSSSSNSSAAMVIDDLSSMKASISINEVDATKVKAGQKVSLTFDAIDGLTLTGKVDEISAVGTDTQGVVTYPATISFDSLDERVRPQMSVSATITTDVKQDVLMVSNSAVKTSGDTHYVLVMQNGTPVQTTIEIGSSNDTSTEITKGLNEGDTIVTQTITKSSSNSSSSSNTGSGMQGMGALTGGGPSR